MKKAHASKTEMTAQEIAEWVNNLEGRVYSEGEGREAQYWAVESVQDFKLLPTTAGKATVVALLQMIEIRSGYGAKKLCDI